MKSAMMVGLAVVLAAICCASAFAVNPKPQGDAGYNDAGASIFLDGELTFVYVTMDPADLQDCLANPWSDEYKVCSVRVVNSVIDETIDNVGVRPRGNTSRASTKKSWKLKFNEFVPGREFHGLEKMNINGEHNDVSITRSKLAWDLFGAMGVPAPRAHHVQFKINDGSYVEGVHVQVEQIDDEFVEAWFGNDTGNLYKCLYQGDKADLKYVSPGTAATYQNLGGGSTYAEEINEDAPDYSDLAAFIDFVNNTDDAAFAAGIVDWFSVDNFLRSMAVDVTIGQWDNYWYGANNYFLYHNPDSGRFEYIPYDYDNTYGVDFFGIDWANRAYDTWGDGGYGGQAGSGGDDVVSINPDPAVVGEQVTITYDPSGRPLEGAWGVWLHYGWNNWNPVISPRPAMSWNDGLGVWQIVLTVPSGAWQLDFVFTDNSGTWDNNYGQDWHFTVTGDKADSSGTRSWEYPPLVRRLLDIPAYEMQYRRYLRELANGPFSLGETEAKIDQIKAMIGPYAFQGSYAGGAMDWNYTYVDFDASYTQPAFYQANGSGWDWGLKPFITARTNYLLTNVPAPASLPRLFVNEILPINGAGLTDEAGEVEDWVEIYNDESVAVDMGGMYLSDDPGEPKKWVIPAGVTIPAKGFLLVWCDDEPLEGALHATFKLSGSGEGVGIFHDDANGNVLIDYLSYPSLGVDISYGRYPDGTENLMEFTAVTPRGENDNSGGPPPEPGPTPPVFVNEWMADNDGLISDQAGEYDDWFELYNAGDTAVDLGGRFLTDDPADKNKWRIPDGTTIPAGGHLLFWADDDEEQGDNHASFKLSASGESVGLYDRTSNYLAEIDLVTFGAQATDVSEGRYADGRECIKVLRLASPGASNVVLNGDTDDDGYVDAVDFAEIIECVGGPGIDSPAGCGACTDGDLDDDGDVDLKDFSLFSVYFAS